MDHIKESESRTANALDLCYIPSVLRGIGDLLLCTQDPESRSQTFSNDSILALGVFLQFLGEETEKGLDNTMS